MGDQEGGVVRDGENEHGLREGRRSYQDFGGFDGDQDVHILHVLWALWRGDV